uniref:BAR domain-containing protein n=1 Tax=Elaeophora elaphi TaxID=1147741 RepID=A0A0R3RW47_9BILA
MINRPLNLEKDPTAQQETNATAVQQRGGFRKLLMKISEKIGATEKTEYKKSFQNMCKGMDEYKVMVEDIAKQLVSILQQDPRYVPKPLGKMEVEAPSQEDPFELLQIALKELEHIQTSALKLASLHREYQRRGRRAIHGIRTFINVDYENICNARNALEKFRQALDFARYELKSAKTLETIQVNNSLYADAFKNYQKQLYIV